MELLVFGKGPIDQHPEAFRVETGNAVELDRSGRAEGVADGEKTGIHQPHDVAGIRLFDVYEGTGVPEGLRSLAYALQFSAADRTLKDDEVNGMIQKILGDLKAKLEVELRS